MVLLEDSADSDADDVEGEFLEFFFEFRVAEQEFAEGVLAEVEGVLLDDFLLLEEEVCVGRKIDF